MRRLFLDIGAHWGETLEEVLSARWRFDHIFAFEPDEEACGKIKTKFDAALASKKLTLVEAGLSNQTAEATLYGDNAGGGASLFSKKKGIDAKTRRKIDLQQASEFFAQHVSRTDLCIAKLNCEGAEVAILEDLLASGEVFKLDAIMIDFDIAKVRGMGGEARRLRRSLLSAGFSDFQMCDDVMIGETHAGRIANWLFGLDCSDESSTLPADERPGIARPGFARVVSRRIRGF